MKKEIYDYEVVLSEKEDVVITYDLDDGKALIGIESASIVARENNNKSYELIVFVENDSELVKFMSLDSNILDELKNKRILLASMSKFTNDVDAVILIKEFSIKKE